MKTWMIMEQRGIQSPIISAVKADTSRQALNLVINEYVKDGSIKDYYIERNEEYHYQFTHNDKPNKQIEFTVIGNNDLESIITEVEDNEIYNLEV